MKRKWGEIRVNKNQNHGKPGKKKSQKSTGMKVTSAKHDFFDASEDYRENINELKKFEDVDVYDYELPDNFKDEEIDEDEAFDDEDYQKFGDVFSGGQKVISIFYHFSK